MHTCAPDEPYRERKYGPAAVHPDAEYVGERFGPNGQRLALRRCRVCGTRFMTVPTEDELEERGR
jgi:hypothetical protein